ncbi:hypothetical protein [Streptomyces sp. NBC_00425]|uniref:hypothetical protein n=1 Tax=Streptomyces sp. NBC_00425 TaxID=2975740 RepID=UPI002E20D913
MTEPSAGADDGEPFEVSGSPQTAVSQVEFEGVNVCRVAALSMMFGGDRERVGEVAPELREIGFSERLSTGQSTWQAADPLEQFPDLREQEYRGEGRNRVRLWQMLNEEPQPQSANAFLVAVLGSNLERESAAAAAALWRANLGFDRLSSQHPDLWEFWHHLVHMWGPFRGFPWEPFAWSRPGPIDFEPGEDDPQGVQWNPDQWTEIYDRAMSERLPQDLAVFLIRLLVLWRLDLALRSPDAVTRSLAMAAVAPVDDTGGVPAPPRGISAQPGGQAVSTMIHGTFAWMGDWWRPGGDFHAFILPHRPNLYSRGGRFSWSGAYRNKARQLAADDFCKWASDEAPNGLQTLFAHSFGGEIAARAVLTGTPLSELVLLSSPATRLVKAVVSTPGLRVVDVRLRFDPVLVLARTRQRIPPAPNLTTVFFDRWRLGHGATHMERVWAEEDVFTRGRI